MILAWTRYTKERVTALHEGGTKSGCVREASGWCCAMGSAATNS